MILLTSDGLTSNVLRNEVERIVKENGFKKAAVIVTAAKWYKKKSSSALALQSQLQDFGLNTILFDFGDDDSKILDDFDVIAFDGGSPFYLALKLKEYHMKPVLQRYHEKDKFIIGISGGSLALQETLALIDVFAKDMKMRHGGDLEGMGLVEFEMLPHKSRYQQSFVNFQERFDTYQKKTNHDLFLVDDGEGILVNDTIRIIK